MTQKELLARISVNPQICFGKPSIRGHRIWVSLILDFLPSGIAVLRVPKKATKDDIIVCIERLITKFSTTPIVGKLWIIDSKSIPEYQPNPEL